MIVVVRRVRRIERVQKREGPEVDRETHDGRVIRIQHPVHEAVRLPRGDSARVAVTHLAVQPREAVLGLRALALDGGGGHAARDGGGVARGRFGGQRLPSA